MCTRSVLLVCLSGLSGTCARRTPRPWLPTAPESIVFDYLPLFRKWNRNVHSMMSAPPHTHTDRVPWCMKHTRASPSAFTHTPIAPEDPLAVEAEWNTNGLSTAVTKPSVDCKLPPPGWWKIWTFSPMFGTLGTCVLSMVTRGILICLLRLCSAVRVQSRRRRSSSRVVGEIGWAHDANIWSGSKVYSLMLSMDKDDEISTHLTFAIAASLRVGTAWFEVSRHGPRPCTTHRHPVPLNTLSTYTLHVHCRTRSRIAAPSGCLFDVATTLEALGHMKIWYTPVNSKGHRPSAALAIAATVDNWFEWRENADLCVWGGREGRGRWRVRGEWKEEREREARGEGERGCGSKERRQSRGRTRFLLRTAPSWGSNHAHIHRCEHNKLSRPGSTQLGNDNQSTIH